MDVRYVFIWIIVALIVLIAGFVIFGLVYRPKYSPYVVNPARGVENPMCQREKTTCETDQDCKKCVDAEEMVCVPLTRSKDQEKKYGKSEKVCLPKAPDKPCNTENGGIWTWTGWAGTESMEWDCLCTYPDIAGGHGCEVLNPDVCKGGNWNYNAATASDAPTPYNCSCPSGTHLIAKEPSQTPICVPAGPGICDGKEMCEKMYSHSTFVR